MIKKEGKKTAVNGPNQISVPSEVNLKGQIMKAKKEISSAKMVEGKGCDVMSLKMRGEEEKSEDVDNDNKDEHPFFYYIPRLKNNSDAVRSATSRFLRDYSLSTRRETISINDGLIVTHDYFLRDRTPKLSNVLEVDHTLECQLISHCMMQTKILFPLLKAINLSETRTGQGEAVKAFLKPIYDIHNGTNRSTVGTFNLHLFEKRLNILKGCATTDFIHRQYSAKSGEKGGPVDFEKYYKGSYVVKEGLMDADVLAGKMETLILNVEEKYKNHLMDSNNSVATKKEHDKRMLALTETMNQVIDKMIEGNKSR